MSHQQFEQLRERLLHAGIAPRHVRRYIGELRDHFDDLVREETANGRTSDDAENNARMRLGNDRDLADVVLARPDLRSISARFPWAVFGAAPIALVIVALFGGVLIEAGFFNLISPAGHHSADYGHPPAEWKLALVNAWNLLTCAAAPFLIAVALAVVGVRQRLSAKWVLTGIGIACFLGAFQMLSFTDDGFHGELSLGSGLMPPFPQHLIMWGIVRAVITFALAAGLYWYGVRRMQSDTPAFEAVAAE